MLLRALLKEPEVSYDELGARTSVSHCSLEFLRITCTGFLRQFLHVNELQIVYSPVFHSILHKMN
jgi:hypothetical protein